MSDLHEFNYDRILRENFGDAKRLTAFLHNYVYKQMQQATVSQWFRRKSVPSDMFAILAALLEIEIGGAKLAI